MQADDLGAQHEPHEHETDRGSNVRAIHGLDGRRHRHRRRRRANIQDHAPVIDLSVVEREAEGAAQDEPLFTPALPAASPDYELPAILSELKVPPVVIPAARERHSRIRGVRSWWRQESLARAAEKRALATAEAVLRAQAIQSVSAPAENAPTAEEQAGSMRSMLTLNEERFQSLGLRSDRLRDELVGISTSIADLRGLVASGGRRVGKNVAADDLLSEVQGRFDSLLPALSEELARRSEESEGRIALLLSAHAAELAAHLERAVERIGTALPATRPEMQRLPGPDGGAIERALGTLPAELEKVRSASDARLELIEANATAKHERLRAEQNQQLERIQGSTGNELSRIREEIAGISESIRGALADVVLPAHAEPVVLPDPSAPATAHDPEVLDRRFMELLVAMNTNTDRLADALHRGLYALELQVARRRV